MRFFAPCSCNNYQVSTDTAELLPKYCFQNKNRFGPSASESLPHPCPDRGAVRQTPGHSATPLPPRAAGATARPGQQNLPGELPPIPGRAEQSPGCQVSPAAPQHQPAGLSLWGPNLSSSLWHATGRAGRGLGLPQPRKKAKGGTPLSQSHTKKPPLCDGYPHTLSFCDLFVHVAQTSRSAPA